MVNSLIAPRRRRLSLKEAFTLVELMVVIAISATGFMAVLYMQSSLLKGTGASWDVTCATNLARHTLETIKLEGIEWYNDTGAGVGGLNQLKFGYLNSAPAPVTGSSTGWLKAPYANTAQPFQLTNQLGDNVGWDEGANDEITNNTGRRFCVQYRLTWLVPHLLLRAETRVGWPRPHATTGNYDNCPADMFNHPEDIMSVALPMTVMKNVFVTK